MVLKHALNTLTIVWYLSVAVIIYFGWVLSEQRYLVADSGIGYWLGIFGGSMMLLLLIYPVRKRKPRWKYSGSVKFWFRLHMFLGVMGPVLIILHSGYRLGSLNGSVAFFSMLIVAGSGLIGRYLYRRIHHGLYGEKIHFEEVFIHDEQWQQQLDVMHEQYPELIDEIQQIEKKLVNRHTGINRSLWFYLSMNWKLNGLRRKSKKILGKTEESSKIIDRLVGLKPICKLGVNEILFSYWHVLHIPLFVMLVFSGITHVIVVHYY